MPYSSTDGWPWKNTLNNINKISSSHVWGHLFCKKKIVPEMRNWNTQDKRVLLVPFSLSPHPSGPAPSFKLVGPEKDTVVIIFMYMYMKNYVVLCQEHE